MNTVIKFSSFHLQFAISKLISGSLSSVLTLLKFLSPHGPLEGTADKRVSAAAAAVWHPRKKADKDKTTDSCSR